MGLASANARPTVAITQWPTSTTDPSMYVYEFSWAGSDLDGSVVAFRYVIDPPHASNQDTVWVVTGENRKLMAFRVDSLSSLAEPVAHRYHTLVVEAIDNAGEHSAPVWVSFNATTVAPTVRITSPVPSALGERSVAPAVQINWVGNDPDGVPSHLPVKYKYHLFSSSSSPSIAEILVNPDTVRTLFAPGFAGWDSLGGAATSIRFADLTPSQRYLFVIVAFDTAGAMSPMFSLNQNMLNIQIYISAAIGPQLTLYNDYFFFRYPSGGWYSEPSSFIQQEFAADIPIPMSWSVIQSTGGGFIQGYRWAVDLQTLDDDSPRTNESTDLSHWSQLTTATSVMLPAFDASPTAGVSGSHYFYLQAEDDIGYSSLAVVQFICRRPTFRRDLLIVNDTGFPVDKLVTGGCVDRPRGAWPTLAELDTFFCAVGNVPWRCYPTGTRSSPGLFAGYDFDTIGTRSLALSGLTLGLLDNYRNIIWMTDFGRARTGVNPVGSLTSPMPMLRGLLQPGVNNALATWIAQGGRLWLMGGGAAYASLRDYKRLGQPDNTFSQSAGELVPGRLMYNFPHWRGQITLNYTVRAARSPRAVGGWPGAPDYSLLPPLLAEKSSTTDPLPPYRGAGDFYISSHVAEYLSLPTEILEVGALPGDAVRSTLDTLYTTQGGIAGSNKPVMTIYHGADNAPVVFSGFPLWYFQRSQAIALVDFVLHDYWAMPRRPVSR